jgi:hypothetical protein
MPSEMSAITDALIAKFGGQAATQKLGIGATRVANASAQLDLLVKTTLPEAMKQAHAAALAVLGKRTALAKDQLSSELRSVTTGQLRALVEKGGLLHDKRYATHRVLLEKAPDLLDVLQACAVASCGAVYKQSGETPVDQILIEQTMRGAGGQTQRMQALVNLAFADRGISVSKGTITALLKQANIKALAVKHTLNPPKSGKHYCCAEIKTDRQIAHLFSAYCVRLSIDQKANLKSNSDHNTAEGGNRKTFQWVTSERTRLLTYSHGAGGDHLAKYGLFSMLLVPVRKDQRDQLGLSNFNLRDFVSSYSEADAFFERPGLALVLGHCQSIQPENAFRDAADVRMHTHTCTCTCPWTCAYPCTCPCVHPTCAHTHIPCRWRR